MPLHYGNGSFANLIASGNALGDVQPVNHGISAWTFDPIITQSSQALTSGQPRLSAIYIAKSVSITKLYWWVTGAGVTPTATQNEVGIYNSSGTLLASANVDADVTSTGLKTTTIASTALAAGSFYWVAVLVNAATPPSLAWVPSTALAGGSGPINVGLSVSTMRFGVNGSGLTALAASITPASNAISGSIWAAVGP